VSVGDFLGSAVPLGSLMIISNIVCFSELPHPFPFGPSLSSNKPKPPQIFGGLLCTKAASAERELTKMM